MEVLSQPEYVHVLINHLPLTGLFVALLCLVGGAIIRNRAAVFLGMGLVSLFSLSAWPVYVYGEQAYDRVYSMADDAGDAYLKQHKEVGENWIWLYYLTASVGVVGIGAGLRWPKCLWVTAAATAILTIASLGAGAAIADYGGKVRHPEFRRGRPPDSQDRSARPGRQMSDFACHFGGLTFTQELSAVQGDSLIVDICTSRLSNSTGKASPPFDYV